VIVYVDSSVLARCYLVDEPGHEQALALLDADLGQDGPVTVVAGDQRAVEEEALHLVVKHGLRAMDSWHLATAKLGLPLLAEPHEELGFASRDSEQSAIAATLGFRVC
jgi:predicted nucleic acid-binding protein